MNCCGKCKNVGNFDRAFRLFAAFLLMGHGIYFNSALVVAIALIPLLTGLMRFCPCYALLKLSTAENKDSSSSCCANSNQENNNNNNSSNNNEENKAA